MYHIETLYLIYRHTQINCTDKSTQDDTYEEQNPNVLSMELLSLTK